MYCTNCGKEIKSNSKFCPFCGNAVNNSGQNEIISEKQREQEYEEKVPEKAVVKEKIK